MIKLSLETLFFDSGLLILAASIVTYLITKYGWGNVCKHLFGM